MPRPEYDFDPQEPWPAAVRGCLIGGLAIPVCLVLITAFVSPDDYGGPCGVVSLGIILGSIGYVRSGLNSRSFQVEQGNGEPLQPGLSPGGNPELSLLQ